MIKTNRKELRGRFPHTRTHSPAFRVCAYGNSDVGLRREANEDSFLLLPKNALFIVADGMGGHAGGQVASKLTVQTVGLALVRRLAEAEAETKNEGTPLNIAKILSDAISEACAAVYDYAREYPALTGMGSTVSVLLVYGAMAWIGHGGDSRAYLMRNGRIYQVTEDHSLVQEQVSAGLITPSQAKVSTMRNIITRSIGFEREVRVDTGALPLQEGDRFLLCSDGLTGHIEDEEILEMVEHTRLRTAPDALIALANERGGDDNTTVVIAKIGSKKRIR